MSSSATSTKFPLQVVLSLAALALARPLVAAHEPDAGATTTIQKSAAPSPVASTPPPSQALLRELCAQPRLAGTIGSKIGADIVVEHLRAAGWRTEIESFDVLLALPRTLEFEVYADGTSVHTRFERFDPDAIPPGDIPPVSGYAKSGEVRAQVVDVGRGLRADFERLKAAGVELEGTIALARYGGAYRGIKVDLAQQYGCVGVLLFNDPARDGALRGPAWPEGPWKPTFEAERGSIAPMGRTPGDPTTPGWASARPGEKGKRLAGAELDAALPKIPALPIGAADAQQILSRLAQRVSGDGVAQPIGPGPVEARIKLDMPRELRTIHNVIATWPGASDDYVLIGNHRDAWVRGANDAGSGTVTLLRAAQHVAEKARGGWKSPNTLKLAFWDAEEWGLIGSTEWAEAHADSVRERCIAYVNFDVAVSGTHMRGGGGTPGMLTPLERALARVSTFDERGEVCTLLDDWRASLDGKKETSLGLPGSGSDFAVFVHHLGIPCLDLGLGGAASGQYHTAFDDVAIVERFIDPGFVGHELAGRLAFELLCEFGERGRTAFDADQATRALIELARQSSIAESARERLIEALTRAQARLAAPGADSAHFWRTLLDPRGMRGRAWYQNPWWTPGLEDGYGSETCPTLRAVEGDDDAFLQRELDLLVQAVDRLGVAATDAAPAGSR